MKQTLVSLASADILELTSETAVVKNLPCSAPGALVEFFDQGESRALGLVEQVWRDEAHITLLGDLLGLRKTGLACAVRESRPCCEVGLAALGRVLNWTGTPLDSLPPVVPDKRVDLYGRRLHPLKKTTPTKQLLTGIGAVDGYTPIMAGSRIAVVGPSRTLAWQAARVILSGLLERQDLNLYASVARGHVTEQAMRSEMASFSETGEIAGMTLFYVEDDRPSRCDSLATCRALSLGEYLAFEVGRDVVSVIERAPSEEFDDLSMVRCLERGGVLKEGPGSHAILCVTSQVPSLPSDLFDVILIMTPGEDGSLKFDSEKGHSRFRMGF